MYTVFKKHSFDYFAQLLEFSVEFSVWKLFVILLNTLLAATLVEEIYHWRWTSH